MFEIHLKLNDSRHVRLKILSYNLFNSKTCRIICCQSITFIYFIFYYFDWNHFYWIHLSIFAGLFDQIIHLCFAYLFCFVFQFRFDFCFFFLFAHILCTLCTVARSIEPIAVWFNNFFLHSNGKKVEIQTQLLQIQKVDKPLCGIWWSLNVSGSAESASFYLFCSSFFFHHLLDTELRNAFLKCCGHCIHSHG